MGAMLLCNNATAQGHNIDSLCTVVKSSGNTLEKIKATNQLSREFYLKADYDSALYYSTQAKLAGEKASDKKGIANALNNTGNVMLAKGEYKEALESFNKALEIFEKTEDKQGIGNCYNNIANIHLYRAEYEQATPYYEKSLKIRTEINDKQGIADSYNNMGIIAYYQGNYPLALKNYLNALKYLKGIKNLNGIARSYSNIGSIYFRQGENEEALKNFSDALKIQKEIGDKQGIGRSYNNIASIHFSQGKHPEALENFILSLNIKKEINDVSGIGATYINIGSIYYVMAMQPNVTKKTQDSLFQLSIEFYSNAQKAVELAGDKQGLAMTYNNIGSIYISLQQHDKSLEYLYKGLATSKEIGSKNDIKASYQGLASADSAMGNWKSALENYRLFIAYRDSLVNEENTKKIVEIQMNFEFEQKELETKAEQDKKEALYDAEIKRQKLLGWFLGGGTLLALLLSVAFFNRHRLKQKHEFQRKLNTQQKEQAMAVMESQEQERKRIAEDLHDGLGHLLSTVKLNLQALPENQKKYYFSILQLLDQATGEINNISFNLMPQTLEEVGLIAALEEMTNKIKKSGLVNINLHIHEFDESLLPKQIKFNIYRILQEAVNNILKHAEAQEINIQIINQEDNLTIMVEDNGRGFNVQNLNLSGRGLRNIVSRSEWLNATLSIDSTPDHGTTLTIELPTK